MDGEEPTQATQNVLDPRREGKQNSGFSDDDISDIICVLYPHSETARRDVQLLVAADSPLIIGKDEVDSVEPDYDLEDHASRFESSPFGHGNHAIILRLSSGAKNPKQGFAFGRNKARCDVVFDHDPLRRVSNVHFRIYVNEFGIVMLEDQSTNGTWVDRELLTAHPKDGGTPTTRWALSSGSLVRIYLHHKSRDLTFRVRIPRREAEYEKAYHQKVEEFFIRHGLPFQQPAAPIGQPGTGGHVDVFRQPAQPLQRQPGGDGAPGQQNTTQQVPVGSRTPRRRDRVIRNEWTGSGKYNRVGTIGKGAFAVVYKVTAKYDGKPYAAKELDRRRFMKNGVLDQKVETEMKIMQRVQHPNIVRYIENFDWDERLLIIIMEYIGGGDLGKAILDDGPMTEDMVQVMSQQLLSALGYLHLNNITHRDVKPDNILISSLEPLDVKLTDFGLSKMVDNEQTFLRTFCGTLLYCAPEVYTEYTEYDDNGFRYRGQKARRMPGQRYNHAIDIWSLGGVIFFTLTGSPPYPVKTGISHSELLHKIMTTRLDVSPLQDVCVSERGIDFLSRMLQRRPENRATITELDSHSWLGGPGSIIDASQSYDVITDDEDDTAGYREEMDVNEDDRVDDSGDDMDKENQQAQQPGRLFGEIPGSAIGSSGAIPEDFVARRNDFSMGETEILGQENGSIQERTATHHIASYAQNQSADELQSLVEKAASQSLGGDDLPQNGFSVSNYSDFNTSKRKPPSTDTSGEWDGSTSTAKPFYKRLKSEGNIDEISDATMEECKLLLSVPPISRSPSGRQINGPVDKIVFWEQDHKTWHLQYPEMTQLQLDAFIQAASTRGEEFKPGKTPLWDLAMRHFPPGLSSPEPEVQRLSPTPQPGLRRDDTRLVGDSMADFPPTAPPVDTPSSDMATPDTQIVVPVQMDAASTRPVGVVESHPNSCISDISFAITDSLVSFGRGPDNSKPFQPRTEPRVPKNAFKILLWKEGYDPSRSPKKTPHPWLREESELDDDGSSYSFWISTKATIGIKINGLHLASSDPKNPSSPSRHWTRLHNNDNLLLWGAHDASREQTTVVFRCFWGASSQPRQDVHRLTLADAETAAKLDAACAKTEGRIRNAARKIRMEDAAKSEYLERQKNVDRERQRSNVFETRRVEAMQFVGRQSQFNSSLLSGFTGPSSRRGSPASAPPPASRLHGLE